MRSLHAVLAVMKLGWDSAFQYYLIPLIPFMMFNDRARMRVVSIASGIVLATFVALRWLAPATVAVPAALGRRQKSRRRRGVSESPRREPRRVSQQSRSSRV